jgi:hypothetical protein
LTTELPERKSPPAEPEWPEEMELVGWVREEGIISQREKNVLIFKNRRIQFLACKLNVIQQHSRIIKQMDWEHITKNHACSRINSLNHVKPNSQ